MRYVIFLTVFFLCFAASAQDEVLHEAERYIAARKYSSAEKILQESLKVYSSPELKDKLGEAYSFQEKWDQAIDVYEELTDIHPKNAEYQFKYGGVLARKAQNSNKLKALMLIGKIKNGFMKAAELDPKHIEARWGLVDLYVSLPGIVGGSTSKAFKYAKELKSISAIEGYLALGYVYEYDDEPQQAEENYMKALNYVDGLEEVTRNQLNYQIGKICGDYGRYLDRGIKHMDTYINNYTVKDGVPIDWAYYRMARLYRHKENKREANVWIKKALAKRPDFKQALEEQTRIKAL
ncbi:MAG: tetratricopeptide repeat protein [Bacteroidota bacterium]